MNTLDVRRAVEATVSPLSDITRAGVWQRIERELETPAPTPYRLRHAILACSAVAVLAVVAYISLRADAPSPAAPSHGTALVFDAGVHSQRWESDVLDIHGPAQLRLERHLVVRVLHVAAGTLHVRHTGAPLIVSTPSSTTWVSGPVFAVRVQGQITEIASGEQAARALVERAELSLAPVAPAPGSAAVLPPAVDPGAAVPRPRRPVTPATETEPEPEPEPETETETETKILEAASPERVAAETYALAESAMRAGDVARAETLLARLVTDHPDTRIAAAAQLDLARLAFDRRDFTRALTLVDRLLAATADPNLAPPAQRLRCKILVAQGRPCP